MTNPVVMSIMPIGSDFSVFQWFRDNAGYPFMNPLIDMLPAVRDQMANAAFEEMLNDHTLLNNPVDFNKLKSKTEFAFIRAMNNAGTADKAFDLNWDGTKYVRLPRGPYCNWVTGANMLDIVSKFYETVSRYDLGELPPVLDYEPRIPANPNDIIGCLGKMNSLFKHPKGVIVYSSYSFWSQIKPTPTFMNLSYINKWAASWTTASQPTMPPGWPSFQFWQYTDKGNGYDYGVKSAQIDLDRFNGTLADLKTWFRYQPEPQEESLDDAVRDLRADMGNLQIRVYALEHKTFLQKLFGK